MSPSLVCAHGVASLNPGQRQPLAFAVLAGTAAGTDLAREPDASHTFLSPQEDGGRVEVPGLGSYPSVPGPLEPYRPPVLVEQLGQRVAPGQAAVAEGEGLVDSVPLLPGRVGHRADVLVRPPPQTIRQMTR